MACNVQIVAFNGLVHAGSATPSELRVTGKATGCSQVTITSTITNAVTVPVTADEFVATIPIIVAVNCGATVTVRAECVGSTPQNPCADQVQNVPLPCCVAKVVSVFGRTAVGALDPYELRVQGTLQGCISNQVMLTSSAAAPLGPIPVNPVTGGFTATMPVTGTLHCDDRVTVVAECYWPTPPGPSTPVCSARSTAALDCGGCPRASVSFTAAPCVSGLQPVTLHAIVEIPGGATQAFEWDFGDGSPAYAFVVNNAAGTASTQHVVTVPAHSYAPGTYTAVLRAKPPGECPTFPLTFNVVCVPNCPTGTIVVANEGPCVMGMREITFDATVANASSSTAFGQWILGYPHAGSQTGKIFSVPAGATQSGPANSGLEQKWEYPPGTYTVYLDIGLSNPGCPNPSLVFTVTDCPKACEVLVDYQPKPVPCLQPNGAIPVTFTATLNPPNPGYTGPFTWEVTKNGVSQGSHSQSAPTIASPQQFQYTFNSPGTYDVTCTILTPGCKDADGYDLQTDTGSASPQIIVRSCCPTITSFVASQVSPCTIAFTAQVDNPNGAPLTFDWTFHDGTTAQTTTGSTTHTFPVGGITSGVEKVTVTAAGCPPVSATVSIAVNCFCPAVGTPSATVTGCIPGSVTVALASTVSGSGVAGFAWTVTDPSGAVFTKTTPTSTTTDGTTDGMWTNTGSGSTGALPLGTVGGYAVTVAATGSGIDPSCKAVSAPSTFAVPACPPPPPPPSEGTGCALLRAVGVILIVLGALVVMFALCVLVPPACVPVGCNQSTMMLALGIGLGLILAGLIVLVIWLFVCPTKPCQWGWLIAGQILLGVGVMALFFVNCCPALWIIAAIGILGGIFCLGRWVTLCGIGPCRLAAEVAIVLISTVVPIVGLLSGIPVLALCISGLVSLIVSIVNGALALFLANCVKTGAP